MEANSIHNPQFWALKGFIAIVLRWKPRSGFDRDWHEIGIAILNGELGFDWIIWLGGAGLVFRKP